MFGAQNGSLLAAQQGMRVISASGRTDFYTPWLLERLDAGFHHVVNARSGEPALVSLECADVLAIGLFTRDRF